MKCTYLSIQEEKAQLQIPVSYTHLDVYKRQHIDSPRLDIKQNPLYEETGLVLLDTHYYGGIKKYQWVAIPLAIHGVCLLYTSRCV